MSYPLLRPWVLMPLAHCQRSRQRWPEWVTGREQRCAMLCRVSPCGALMVSSPNVTALLGDWSRGDPRALPQLLPLVYTELRRAAGRQLRGERGGHTLQATA